MMSEQNVNKIVRSVLVVLGALSLFLVVQVIIAIPKIGDDGIYQNSVTLTGEGEVVAIPDVASFTFTVEESSETVETAQNMATAKTNAAIDVLKNLGVEEKDLKTQGYNIFPKYEYKVGPCYSGICQGGNNVLIGYTVSQNLEVKIRDTKKAGEALTAMGSVGVSNLSGLQFVIDDESKLIAEARSKAIADAKEKAKALAKDLRVDLGEVVGFYEENNGGYPRPMYDMVSTKVESDGMSVPILPTGESTVSVRVSVTYKID